MVKKTTIFTHPTPAHKDALLLGGVLGRTPPCRPLIRVYAAVVVLPAALPDCRLTILWLEEIGASQQYRTRENASREIVAFTTIADGCISAWAISRRWSSSDGSVTRILVSTKPEAAHLDPLFIRGSDATIRLTLIASSCDLRNDGGPDAPHYLSEIECNGSG